MHCTNSARTRSVRTSRKHLKPILAAVLAMPALMQATTAMGAVKYWDRNGSTTGSGANATGNWDILASNWNVNSSGTGSTTTWAANDTAVFSAGTDSTGGALTITGTMSVAGMTVEEGSLSVTSGVIGLVSGGLTMNSGTKLSLPGFSNLTGAAGTIITLDGGTIENTASATGGPSFVSPNFVFNLTSNGGIFSTANVLGPTIIQTGTPGSNITGVGALTKTGVGVLAIATTANTYSGGTIINNGEIRIRTSNNTLPISTQVTINSPGILNLNGLNQQVDSITGNGAIGFGTGTLTIGGTETTVFTGSWAPVASVVGSGGVTSGNGRIIMTAGNLTLNPGFSSTLTGSVSVAGGTLNVMSGSLGTAALDIYVNSGTLNLSNGAQTIENLSGSGGTLNLASSTVLTTSAAASRTYSGVLTGSGSLVLNTAQTLRLTGASTAYTGNITASSGTIEIGAGNALGAGGNISLTGGSLRSTTTMTLNAGKTIVLGASGGTIDASAGTMTFAGPISGTTPLTKIGAGALLLTGASNTQSKNIITAGTLNVTNEGALGTVPASTMADNISINAATLQVSGGFAANVKRGMTIAGGSTINESSGSFTFNGAITGAGGLTKSGSGTLVLNGANDFTGGMAITGGLTHFNSNTAAGNVANLVTVTPASQVTLRNSVLSSNLQNDIQFVAGATTTDLLATTGNVFQMSGHFIGTAPLTRGLGGGNGTVELDGNNSSWSGGMTFKQGTLALGHKNALGTGPMVITLQAAGNPLLLDSVTDLTGVNAIVNTMTANSDFGIDGTNNIELSGGITLAGAGGTRMITVTNSGNTILSGQITSVATGLTKAGAGVLQLKGNNNYAGVTTVSGGILAVNAASGNAIPDGTNLTSGSLRLDGSNQIADTGNMTLGGGEFATQNFNETLGTLNLADNSIIDLGAGSGGVVNFADSSAVAWTTGKILTIVDWSGLAEGGGAMQLHVGSDNLGLTADQLAQIQFVDPAGADPGVYSAKYADSNPGEVVAAIPEPGTLSLVGGSVLAMALRRRRRSK